MIEPTVGRVVLFRPDIEQREAEPEAFGGDEPCAALVTCVKSPRIVNLAVFDRQGRHHAFTDVFLRQADEEAPIGAYAEWMPYQVGQAKRYEAEAAAGAR